MPYVNLTYSNGCYGVSKPVTDEDADKLMQQGHELVLVEDRVLAAWQRHCDDSAAFNTLWRTLENERGLVGLLRSKKP